MKIERETRAKHKRIRVFMGAFKHTRPSLKDRESCEGGGAPGTEAMELIVPLFLRVFAAGVNIVDLIRNGCVLVWWP